MTPLLFVGMIGALVALTLYFFATKAPILPPLISEHGQLIDDQIYLTLIITGAIFAIAQLGLAFLVYKYRHREGAKATYLLGSHKLEYTWSAATLVLFVGLNLMGQKVWAEMHLNEHPKPAIEVEVTGLQFKWYIRYPGKDGVFGRRDVNDQRRRRELPGSGQDRSQGRGRHRDGFADRASRGAGGDEDRQPRRDPQLRRPRTAGQAGRGARFGGLHSFQGHADGLVRSRVHGAVRIRALPDAQPVECRHDGGVHEVSRG